MRGDAMSDGELAQRVYDAYDALSPTDDAQMRVLEALRARKGTTQSEDVHKQASRRSRILWLVAIPAAACLAVVALLGVNQDRVAEPTATKNSASEERVIMDVEEAESYEDSSYKSLSLAQTYPLVVLSDGLTLRVEDITSDVVDGAKAEEAVATDAEGTQEVVCWVVDEHYVRYDGEDVWYETTPA